MIEKHLITLLSIIETNGNINKLLRQQLSYKSIAALVEIGISQNYILNENDKITLTLDGVNFLEANKELIKVKKKEEWIEPDFQNKIKPIDKNDVFLPNENELSFLKE